MATNVTASDAARALFHHRLRILNSIDRDELEDAGVDLPDTLAWLKFRDDPYRWFIRACDADADKVWAIIERRSAPRVRPGVAVSAEATR